MPQWPKVFRKRNDIEGKIERESKLDMRRTLSKLPQRNPNTHCALNRLDRTVPFSPGRMLCGLLAIVSPKLEKL